MGVRGLYSFIHTHSDSFLVTYDIHSTQVIVDANNLIHYLYNSCSGLNAAFGGNYDTIFAHFHAFCGLLKSCNVDPVMVFDGGLDMDDRKKVTRHKRMAYRLRASLACTPEKQGRLEIFPLLCRHLFLKACMIHGFTVIQCDYEADDEVASLARSLDCPVISNDSDFVIFGVKFIPLQTLSFASSVIIQDGKEVHALSCKMFLVESFLKKFGNLPRTHLPLLGILLGNDYVTPETFQSLLSSISIPKDNRMSDIHRRLKAVITWLQHQKLGTAVEKILETVKPQSRPEVKQIIEKNLQVYTKEPKLLLSILNNSENDIPAYSFEKNKLPKWFLEKYRHNEFPSWVLEVMCCHRVPLLPQVEATDLNYSVLVALDILRGIVAVLLSDDYPKIEWRDRDGEGTIEVELATRLGWKMKNTVLKFDQCDAGSLSSLSNLPVVTSEDRCDLFHAVLGAGVEEISVVRQFPPEIQTFIHSVLFWARKSNLKTQHLDSILLMVLAYHCIGKKIGKVRSKEKTVRLLANSKQEEEHNWSELSVDELWSAVNRDDCLKFNEMILDLYQLNQKTVDPSKFEKETVHIFAEFQMVFFFTQILNRLLLLPYPESDMDICYNGLFLYNTVNYMVWDQKWRENLKRKCEAPSVFVLLDKLLASFDSVRSNLTCKLDLTKKRRKKKKGLKEGVKRQDKSGSESKEHSGEDEDRIDLVENRFAALLLNE